MKTTERKMSKEKNQHDWIWNFRHAVILSGNFMRLAIFVAIWSDGSIVIMFGLCWIIVDCQRSGGGSHLSIKYYLLHSQWDRPMTSTNLFVKAIPMKCSTSPKWTKRPTKIWRNGNIHVSSQNWKYKTENEHNIKTIWNWLLLKDPNAFRSCYYGKNENKVQ